MLILALTATGCLSPSIPAPSSSAVVDSELIAHVSRAFSEAGVPAYQDIQIAASAGTITLRGPAAEPAVSEQAVRVARAVSGVVQVVASFGVVPSEPSSQPSQAR